MRDEDAVLLGEVLDDHSSIVRVQAVADAEKAVRVDMLVICGIQDEVRAALVRVTDECDDLAPWPGVVDVSNVELRTQLGAARKDALEKRAARTVVALALAIAGAVCESGGEQKEDVHQ